MLKLIVVLPPVLLLNLDFAMINCDLYVNGVFATSCAMICFLYLMNQRCKDLFKFVCLINKYVNNNAFVCFSDVYKYNKNTQIDVYKYNKNTQIFIQNVFSFFLN